MNQGRVRGLRLRGGGSQDMDWQDGRISALVLRALRALPGPVLEGERLLAAGETKVP